MDPIKIREMFEEKRIWVDHIENLLVSDESSGVEYLKYEVEERGQGDYEEYVTIVYVTGFAAKINVTADSLAAILMEVTREVYF